MGLAVAFDPTVPAWLAGAWAWTGGPRSIPVSGFPRPVLRYRMVNRLVDAMSPYLLQHADNPVDWSPEAFEEARKQDVPVLLGVGYASCHWCQ